MTSGDTHTLFSTNYYHYLYQYTHCRSWKASLIFKMICGSCNPTGDDGVHGPDEAAHTITHQILHQCLWIWSTYKVCSCAPQCTMIKAETLDSFTIVWLLLMDFIGNQTVLSRLEVGLVDAAATVEHFLVLRGPPLIFPTAGPCFIRVRVL